MTEERLREIGKGTIHEDTPEAFEAEYYRRLGHIQELLTALREARAVARELFRLIELEENWRPSGWRERLDEVPWLKEARSP